MASQSEPRRSARLSNQSPTDLPKPSPKKRVTAPPRKECCSKHISNPESPDSQTEKSGMQSPKGKGSKGKGDPAGMLLTS